MEQPIVFDMPHATRVNDARKAWIGRLLRPLITAQGFRTAVDVGCGVGHFSVHLRELGLQVVAVDGRAENVAETQRRLPDVRCVVYDVEDRSLRELGLFDVVLCVGLLYHLENPFIAVRNLHALTGRLLIIESVVMPGAVPGAVLLDEPAGRDQALQDSVLVVSEPALIKMLYRTGFPFVYRVDPLPDHDDFHDTRLLHRRRTVVVASAAAIDSPLLQPAAEPANRSPWEKPWATRLWRAARFVRGGR